MLSLKYSSQEELEKSLVTIDFQRQIFSGVSLETAYKHNSDVLSFDAINVSDMPDFVKEKVSGLKDGEISNIISYDHTFIILQTQIKKTGYRGYKDVYDEICKKFFTIKQCKLISCRNGLMS